MKLKGNKLVRIGLQVVIGAVAGFLLSRIPVDRVEAFFYDTAMQLLPRTETSQKAIAINQDHALLEQFPAGLDAVQFKELLQELVARSPKKIIVLNDPKEIIGEDKEIA